ncbi:MAG: VOC family protein [Peptoniphilus sp.]|nr:VOC family protein [Peptoniphilus sp.]MDD7363779.1 VOC family protein [Bacillota bacterium]MDY6044620.1 VOC family protein [Peptoniphilus sp.]
MNYAHTCIRVKDLDASIKFYKEALGYQVTREKDHSDDGFKLVYLALDGDDTELELTYNIGHGAYELGDGYGHMALYSDDFEAEYARIKEAGFEVTELMGLPGEEPHYFFVTDPDGYDIEILRRD